MLKSSMSAAVLVTAAVVSFGSPADAASRSCGSVKTAKYGKFSITVERGPTSCKAAKRLMLDLYAGKGTELDDGGRSLRGWHCDTGAGGGGCFKRGKTLDKAKDFVNAEEA